MRKQSTNKQKRPYEARNPKLPALPTPDDTEVVAETWAATCETRLNKDGNGPMHPDDIVKALLFAKGNLEFAARLLRRRLFRLRDKIKSDPELFARCNEITAGRLWNLRELLFRAAEAGDGQAQRFLLERLWKDEFSTRQEATG